MNEQPTISPSLPDDLQFVCRCVAETSLNPVAAVDGADHIVRYVNPAFCLLAGKQSNQLVGVPFTTIPTGNECLAMLDRVYQTGKAEIHTGRENCKQHPIYWSYDVSPVLGTGSRPLGLSLRVTEATSFHHDIIDMNRELLLASVRQNELIETAEKLNTQLQAEVLVSRESQGALVQKELLIERALKEKDVLLGEIHHRVKNNLQIVHSLLDLQSAQVQDPVVLGMLRESQNRIRSMALIHQTLYQSKDFGRVDFGMFLNSLAPILIQSYLQHPERIVLSIDAEDMHVPINAAIPCGLLSNELISNCLKHAFPGEGHGKIEIRFVHERDDYVVLSVSDDGVGIPEEFDMTQTVSLGLQLVFLLTDQLGGTMTVHRAAPTSFTLRFKIQDPAIAHPPKIANLPETDSDV